MYNNARQDAINAGVPEKRIEGNVNFSEYRQFEPEQRNEPVLGTVDAEGASRNTAAQKDDGSRSPAANEQSARVNPFFESGKKSGQAIRLQSQTDATENPQLQRDLVVLFRKRNLLHSDITTFWVESPMIALFIRHDVTKLCIRFHFLSHRAEGNAQVFH